MTIGKRNRMKSVLSFNKADDRDLEGEVGRLRRGSIPLNCPNTRKVYVNDR